MTGTHVVRTEVAPALAEAALGVTIATDGPCAVAGRYRVERARAGATLPLARLALVLQGGGPARVASPFRGRLLFQDDAVVTSRHVEGFYRVDLSEAFGADRLPAAGCLVFAVLFDHASPVVAVKPRLAL